MRYVLGTVRKPGKMKKGWRACLGAQPATGDFTLILQAPRSLDFAQWSSSLPLPVPCSPAESGEAPLGGHSKVNDWFAADPAQVFQGQDKKWYLSL